MTRNPRTSEEIETALQKLGVALEIAKFYTARHTQGCETGTAAIRKIDDGLEALIALRATIWRLLKESGRA